MYSSHRRRAPRLRRSIWSIAASALALAIDGSAVGQAPNFAAEVTPTPLVTREEAILRALHAAPHLRAAAEGIRAAEGAYRQAGVRPNPELRIEAENFARTGPLDGSDGEYTYSLAQRFERGGKRHARIAVADAERDISRFAAERDRLDIILDVEATYIEAVAAEARVQIAKARALTAGQTRRIVEGRASSARDSKAAAESAAAQAALAAADLDRAIRARDLSILELAQFWGADGAGMRLDAVWFRAPPNGPGASLVDDGAARATPDLAIQSALGERAAASAALERARVKQDPTVSFGVRQLATDSEAAGILTFSMPFAVFDRNKGAIARADAEKRRAEWSAQAEQKRLARALQNAIGRMAASSAEARSLRADVLPRAEAALAAARDGYARGAFAYLEVLNAQRVLDELRMREIDALASAHISKAEVDRLTARFSAPPAGEEFVQ